MHRFVFKALRDVSCPQISMLFRKGHEIDVYEAFKYVPSSMTLQFAGSGLHELRRWNRSGSSICTFLLTFTFVLCYSRPISDIHCVDEYLLSKSE